MEHLGAMSKSRILGPMLPAHSITKVVGSLPATPLAQLLDPPPTRPHIRKLSSLTSGSEPGNDCYLFSPCYSRAPSKVLPKFLVWPVINFY